MSFASPSSVLGKRAAVAGLSLAFVAAASVASSASAATRYTFSGLFASDVRSGWIAADVHFGTSALPAVPAVAIDGTRSFSLPVNSDDAALAPIVLKVQDLNGNSAYTGYLERISGDTFAVVPTLADATDFALDGDESIPDLTIQGIAAPAPTAPVSEPAPPPAAPAPSQDDSDDEDDETTDFWFASWSWSRAEGSPATVAARGITDYTPSGTFLITYYRCNGVAAARRSVSASAGGGTFDLAVSVPAKSFSATANTVQVVHAIAGHPSTTKTWKNGSCAKPASQPSGPGSRAMPLKFIAHWSAKRGSAKVGKRVTVTATTLSKAGKTHHAKVTYSWKVGGTVVSHRKALNLTRVQRHREIVAVVSLTAPGYQPTSKVLPFGRVA